LLLGCHGSSSHSTPTTRIASSGIAASGTTFDASPSNARSSRRWELGPKLLKGPYASLDAYCRGLVGSGLHEGTACAPSQLLPTQGFSDLAGPSEPYQAARVVFTHDPDAPAPMVNCRVGIRTAEGWFVTASASGCRGVFGSGGRLD